MELNQKHIETMVLETLDSMAEYHGNNKLIDRVHYPRYCHALKILTSHNKSSIGDNRTVKILDIGPGGGAMVICLKKFGYKCFAINADLVFEDLIFLSKSEVSCALSEIEIDGLPFADAVFDGVLLMSIIEHFHHSPKLPLLEINRVLKPGGFLYIDTPNSLDLRARIKPWFGRSGFPGLISFFDLPRNHTHVHEYTIKELDFALKKTGFEIHELDFFSDITHLSLVNFTRDSTGQLTFDVGGFHPLRIWDWIRFPYRLLCKVIPSFCDQIYALARKES